MMRITRRGLVAASLVGAVAPAARAEQRAWSGSVDIEQVQVAFIGSGNVGGGTLHYRGRSHAFSITGLGFGGFGISEMRATGNVYNLHELDRFPGAYGQARMGYAAGDQGAGKLWLENTHGVQLELRTHREGLAVSLGADAVVIAFK